MELANNRLNWRRSGGPLRSEWQRTRAAVNRGVRHTDA